ncbi:hypothetical protein [Oscillatoria sp. FACHB-1406]|uniref:hypothetical protein n=1 Tax=Oscillatoria sp. FACHB-1406 TaxID=2692846 RepID=UPI00168322B5|nr:hypothetical protein [Oscillatoria sp. FACHB-1406]MBD2577302.1 hypothetical protein [Oscillatoria sp. FACHB-1406]
MPSKAIVTLTLGKEYESMFAKYCQPLWSQYAQKHGFDLIVFTQPLDISDCAQSRSPAWQKCLILSEPRLQQYERVVWVDADIAINPQSPDITEGVPLNKIGAVDEFSAPNTKDYQLGLEKLYRFWAEQGINYIDNSSPTVFHNNFGLEGTFQSVVQTGVLVLTPSTHRELLEYVYQTYEDKGSSEWNYEMRPLSYEILTHNLEYWLSPQFNIPWPFLKTFYYPFLNRPLNRLERGLRKFGFKPRETLFSQCVTTAFLNNYFLHFAGNTTNEVKYIDSTITSIFEI